MVSSTLSRLQLGSRWISPRPRPMLQNRLLDPPSSTIVTRQLFTRKPKPPGWKPLYKRRPILFTAIASPVVIAGSFAVALAGLFAYDASTYRHKHLEKVNVSDLAVEPERGGPKQLKIARALVDDQDEGRIGSSDKQRLVIVGGGWGVSDSAVLRAHSSRLAFGEYSEVANLWLAIPAVCWRTQTLGPRSMACHCYCP